MWWTRGAVLRHKWHTTWCWAARMPIHANVNAMYSSGCVSMEYSTHSIISGPCPVRAPSVQLFTSDSPESKGDDTIITTCLQSCSKLVGWKGENTPNLDWRAKLEAPLEVFCPHVYSMPWLYFLTFVLDSSFDPLYFAWVKTRDKFGWVMMFCTILSSI